MARKFLLDFKTIKLKKMAKSLKIWMLGNSF
jgi:hypothetical protein